MLMTFFLMAIAAITGKTQLNPAITDVKGPTNFIGYRWISIIASIGNKEK